MQSGLWKRKPRKRLKTKRISNASALKIEIFPEVCTFLSDFYKFFWDLWLFFSGIYPSASSHKKRRSKELSVKNSLPRRLYGHKTTVNPGIPAKGRWR